MTTFTQLNARLKNFLRDWLLVLGRKECLVECATLCVKSEVILNSILWFDRKKHLPFIQNLNLTKSSTTFFSIIFISLSSSAMLELPLELKLESLLSSLELQHWASRTKSATDFKWIKHSPWRVIKSGTFSSLPSTFGSIQSPERKWICNLAILSL